MFRFAQFHTVLHSLKLDRMLNTSVKNLLPTITPATQSDGLVID